MSTEEPVDVVAALQHALEAEYAAVYGYGFVGAHSDDDARQRAADDLDAHRDQRDALRGLLLEHDADPVPPEDAYPLPEDTDTEEVAAFAATLEERAGQTYLQLAATDDPRLRDLACRWLQATTVRGLWWDPAPATFPGFPDGEL